MPLKVYLQNNIKIIRTADFLTSDNVKLFCLYFIHTENITIELKINSSSTQLKEAFCVSSFVQPCDS